MTSAVCTPFTSAQCSVHGKKRGLDYLEADGKGGYQCKADFTCQGNAKDFRPRGICAKHGKTRSLDVMEEDGLGGHCCKAQFPCKDTGDAPSWKKKWGGKGAPGEWNM